MSWALILLTLIESAADDAEKSMSREQRSAAKEREKVVESEAPGNGGVLASAPPETSPFSTIKELRLKAFEKLRDETSEWMKSVLSDAVAYAIENIPREEKSLKSVFRGKNFTSDNHCDIATMFETSIWPSLKNRGWVANIAVEGESAGSTHYSFQGKDVSLFQPATSASY